MECVYLNKRQFPLTPALPVPAPWLIVQCTALPLAPLAMPALVQPVHNAVIYHYSTVVNTPDSEIPAWFLIFKQYSLHILR